MVVEALPTLIHVSVSLFFAGLTVFLWNVNLTVFALVLSWISVCTALYGSITLIPMFRHDSPYYSPLTDLARPVVQVLLFVFTVLYMGLSALVFSCFSRWKHFSGLVHIFGRPFNRFIHLLDLTSTTPKEAALKSSSEIDTRALMWTFDSLDEDHELDRFFSGLPGFHNSRVLKEPLHDLDDRQKLGLLEAAIRLLDRTLSSNLLPDHVRRQRADICTKAIDLVVTPGAYPNIVRQLACEDQYGPAHSTESWNLSDAGTMAKAKIRLLCKPCFLLSSQEYNGMTTRGLNSPPMYSVSRRPAFESTLHMVIACPLLS